MLAKQNGQNRQKTRQYYLQMVNQLRRNVFNLDLKRERVAALCILLVSELKNLGP